MITTTGSLPPSLSTLSPRPGSTPLGLTGSSTPLGMGGGASSPASLLGSTGQVPSSPLSLSPVSQLMPEGMVDDAGLIGGGEAVLPASILSRMGNQSSPLSAAAPTSSSGSPEAANVRFIETLLQALTQLRQDKQVAAAREEQKSAQLQQVLMAVASRAAGSSPNASGMPGPTGSSLGADPRSVMASLPGGRSSMAGLPSSLMTSSPMGLTGSRPPGGMTMPTASGSPMGLMGGRTPIV